MAFSAQGSTFTFKGVVFTATSVSVEAPTPEIVDMTTADTPPGFRFLVPTGDITSTGRIEVDGMGFDDPLPYVREIGLVEFATPRGTITRQAICDACSISAQVGDVFRFRISFIPTDYFP